MRSTNQQHDSRPCVCYVLSYRDPQYVRTRSLLRALELCRGIRVVTAVNSHRGLRRYFETWFALRRAKSTHRPDAYILGFRSHEMFWFAKRIAGEKPMIFDALMSPYGALRQEGKAGPIGRILAPVVRVVERYALLRAQVVLTDTHLHVGYYTRTFGLPAEKFVAIPVGAVEKFAPTSGCLGADHEDVFNVLFYGSFLSLHGIGVIVQAAAQLKDLPIRFDFVGGRASHARRLHHMCSELTVTRYTYCRWVAFERLIDNVIPNASVCLGGPFGGTPQARRVVTGKTSQCLALGSATVVGKIAEDFGFVDKVNCMLVDQADATSLAQALRWAYDHRSSLGAIGAAGQRLYHERLSVRVIAEQLPRAFKLAGLELSDGAQ